MSATEIEYQPSDAKNAKKSRLASVREYAYNPVDKTYFGRTGASWGKIGIFYLVFYSCLAAFCAIMMMLFFQTLSDTRPTQTGMNSLIKGNPGLAFRPMPKVTSTLIKFKQGQEDTYRKYIDNIKILLHKYRQEQEDGNYQDCTGGVDRSSDLPCKFDIDHFLGPQCTEGNQYGFHEGEPCVLLKLNKIFDWEPEYYNESIPEELREADPGYNGEGVAVTCTGENFGDTDNLGEIEFFPSEGFNGRFFPFTGQKAYQSPLVFLRMPNLKWGVVIQVYCKAWAKNIYHHKNDKAGSMRFEILMD